MNSYNPPGGCPECGAVAGQRDGAIKERDEAVAFARGVEKERDEHKCFSYHTELLDDAIARAEAAEAMSNKQIKTCMDLRRDRDVALDQLEAAERVVEIARKKRTRGNWGGDIDAALAQYDAARKGGRT